MATTLIGEARPATASTWEQIEEGASGAPMVDVARPGATATSQAETAQPKPSSAQADASKTGRTEEDAPEVSLANVVTGQASASMPLAPSTAGGAVPEEVRAQEGSAPLGVGTEPSRPLVRVGGDPHAWGRPWIRWANWQDPGAMLFVLDDVTLEKE